MTAVGRSQLILPLRDRAHFLDQFFDQDDAGGLFIPGDLDVVVGEEIDLEIAFMQEQVRFRLRTTVLWKRGEVGRRAEPGIGLGFLPSEATTKGQLLRFARGEDVGHIERATRRFSLPLEVKLTVQQQGSRVVLTDDLSEGGCFLLLDPPLSIGTPVEVTFRSPGALFSWLTVPGRVAWRRTATGDPHRAGMGIEFLLVDPNRRRRLARLIELVRERVGREIQVAPPRNPSSVPSPSSSSSSPPHRSSMLPRK